MQQRYYDPVIGRFYSNDPVGFTGEPDTFNRYSYVANNPYKYADPSGESKKFVAEAVKVAGTQLVSLGKVTQQQAIKIRQQGGDLRSPNLKAAQRIERAAFPGATQTRPETHKLANGEMGEKHIHSKNTVEGKVVREDGHNFIANGVADAMSPVLESLGEGLEQVGTAMQNVEQNFPRTMGVLNALDPTSLAEEMTKGDEIDKSI